MTQRATVSGHAMQGANVHQENRCHCTEILDGLKLRSKFPQVSPVKSRAESLFTSLSCHVPPQPRPARRQLVDQHDHLLLAQPNLPGAPGQDGRVS